MRPSRILILLFVPLHMVFVLSRMHTRREHFSATSAYLRDLLENQRLRETGEVCVSFNADNKIAAHWKPRVEHGITHCPYADVPSTERGKRLGQL